MDPKNQIIPIELLAPVLALRNFRDRLNGADVIILIDSEVVEDALVKVYPTMEGRLGFVHSLMSIFWDLALELSARIFIDRVSTDANPADWPSRNDLKRGQEAGWITVDCKWPGPGS